MSTPASRVEEIVRAALELGTEERDAFLGDVCGADAELRRRVETWLRIRAPRPEPTPTPIAPAPAPATPIPAPAPMRPTPAPRAGWLTTLLLLALIGAAVALTLVGVQAMREREVSIQLAQRLARADLVIPNLPVVADTAQPALDWLVANLVGETGPLPAVEGRLDDFLKEHPDQTRPLREALGRAYLARGDLKPARKQFELAGTKARLAEVEAAAARRADPETLTRLRVEIDTLQKQNQPEKAEPILREIVAILRDHGKDAHDLALQEVRLGRNLLDQGKFADAEPVLREALRRIERDPPPAAWVECDVRSLVGASLLGQKKYAEAEPYLLSGFEGLKERAGQIPEPLRERVAEAEKRLSALREAIKSQP